MLNSNSTSHSLYPPPPFPPKEQTYAAEFLNSCSGFVQLARRDLIGIVLSQSPEYVAPHGSSEAIFGTNPIAIGVPTPGEQPLVLDMATSAWAWYGLLEAQHAGQPVPEDVGYDSQGQVTTDPGAILEGGAIRVFDR